MKRSDVQKFEDMIYTLDRRVRVDRIMLLIDKKEKDQRKMCGESIFKYLNEKMYAIVDEEESTNLIIACLDAVEKP